MVGLGGAGSPSTRWSFRYRCMMFDVTTVASARSISFSAAWARSPAAIVISVCVSDQMTLFPFHQTYDVALRARCAEVPLVGGYQYAVGSLKRYSMIVCVKEMLFEIHCKVHSAA